MFVWTCIQQYEHAHTSWWHPYVCTCIHVYVHVHSHTHTLHIHMHIYVTMTASEHGIICMHARVCVRACTYVSYSHENTLFCEYTTYHCMWMITVHLTAASIVLPWLAFVSFVSSPTCEVHTYIHTYIIYIYMYIHRSGVFFFCAFACVGIFGFFNMY